MRTQAAILFFLTSLAAAQGSGGNHLHHYDGTTEGTSRGQGLAFEDVTVLQRYPWTQCCNRTRLCCVEFTLQDQNPATPEHFYVEVRGSDLSDPLYPLGKPDMSPSGLLAAPMPMTAFFSGPVQQFSLSMPCIPLPGGTGAAADFYVGIRFSLSPLWPLDGASCHFSGRVTASPGEQFLTPPNPMYLAGKPGLAWSWSASAGTVPSSLDRSWKIAAGLYEDVCQPFADNPTAFTGLLGTGLNRNYGYAGIWPDLGGRGDAIGWRVRSVAPVGSVTVLVVGTKLPSPVNLTPFGFDGLLCVDPMIQMVAFTTAESGCATQSKAEFGPYYPSISGGMLLVGAQAVTLETNGATHVSTACTSAL